MNLPDFFEKMPRGCRLIPAKQTGCPPTYLSYITTGFRKASPKVAVVIEKATNNEVSKYGLGNDADEIWGA